MELPFDTTVDTTKHFFLSLWLAQSCSWSVRLEIASAISNYVHSGRKNEKACCLRTHNTFYHMDSSSTASLVHIIRAKFYHGWVFSWYLGPSQQPCFCWQQSSLLLFTHIRNTRHIDKSLMDWPGGNCIPAIEKSWFLLCFENKSEHHVNKFPRVYLARVSG